MRDRTVWWARTSKVYHLQGLQNIGGGALEQPNLPIQMPKPSGKPAAPACSCAGSCLVWLLSCWTILQLRILTRTVPNQVRSSQAAQAATCDLSGCCSTVMLTQPRHRTLTIVVPSQVMSSKASGAVMCDVFSCRAVTKARREQ